MRELHHRGHWVFDLDGTLTVPSHDFAAIRRMLGLPDGIGILEALEAMPPERAAPLWAKLDAFELELAADARAADGAFELLEHLRRRGAALGIVTRNNLANVRRTLEATGLEDFFVASSLMTREHTRPKPDPDGIRRLLDGWRAAPDAAVMVGNHLLDLQAGRAAGTATILVGSGHGPAWGDYADLAVAGLREIIALATD